MPGYVIHLAVASKIIVNKNITDRDYIIDFLLGNIIPDAMARSDKKGSHFWDDKTYANLNRIPNLDIFLNKYDHQMSNPFVLGYYTHLLLDNLFVKEYWREHFLLLDEHMNPENSFSEVRYIRLKGKETIYDREEFFSDELYYGDYDRINPYIFESYPFKKLESAGLWDNPINVPIAEINLAETRESLKNMLDKVNSLYDARESLLKEQLKVFDLEHIFNLMDEVVDNVCEI